MALDTQPLSAGRRGLMLVVLVGFLGGSLGFAQWLVVRKRGGELVRTELGRFGFTVAVEGEFAEEKEGRMGVVAGHPRRVDVFEYKVEVTGGGEGNIAAATEGAGELFQEVFGVLPDTLRMAELAGKAGVEVAGATEDGRSGWLRFAIVENRAVAICYSGAGKFTDADRKVFDEMCVSGVHVDTQAR